MADSARFGESASVSITQVLAEHLHWRCQYRVDKYWAKEWTPTDIKRGVARPYELIEGEGNALMARGVNLLFSGLSTTGIATPYNSTNGALVAGDANLGAGQTVANVADVDVAAGSTTLGTAVSTATWSSGTATITTSAAHGIPASSNFLVTIFGIVSTSPSSNLGQTGSYNGTFVATQTSTTAFTVAIPLNPGTYSSGGTVKAAASVGTATTSSATFTYTYTVTNTLTAGQVVQVSNCSVAAYNGTFVVSSATGSSFTAKGTTSAPSAGTGAVVWGPYNKFRQQISGAPTLTAATTSTANQIVYAATFQTPNANFAWNDWGLENSATNANIVDATNNAQGSLQNASALFNHAFPAGGLGTKTSAAIWTLTVTLSLA